MTVQKVPLHRVMGGYWLERAPGSGDPPFLNNSENEVLVMFDGIEFDYTEGAPKNRQPKAYGLDDASQSELAKTGKQFGLKSKQVEAAIESYQFDYKNYFLYVGDLDKFVAEFAQNNGLPVEFVKEMAASFEKKEAQKPKTESVVAKPSVPDKVAEVGAEWGFSTQDLEKTVDDWKFYKSIGFSPEKFAKQFGLPDTLVEAIVEQDPPAPSPPAKGKKKPKK
jgi:hypothetical protein